MIKPSFYFSWVWAPPGLTIQWSSFSSSLSGIADSSKSQLVSSCCCLATLFYSHKDFFYFFWHHLNNFVFFSSLQGMCWRGIVPSHTIVTRDTFHVPFFLFLLLVGERGWQGTLALLSLTAPPPHCMKPLWGCACDNAYTYR